VATLKKYDLTGEEVGTVHVDDALLEVHAHPQSIKDYIVAIRKNARQWSASTKTRAEINRTGRKPHPQKGGGRARQGDLAAPQYKGGGIVFGPRPKFDMHVRINKKERRAAVRALIAEKIKENCVHVLKSEPMNEPKTKKVAAFFSRKELLAKRALIVGESSQKEDGLDHQNFLKSLRNIQKKEYLPIPQMNGYELARCRHLVILESALSEFLSILGANHE
jgi:large subunit ribosomal protein L4